jgi:glycosyltransferase involved in cell wall biosynthesis
MRVLIATDAWAPQVNGVVRTLSELQRRGASVGLDLAFVTPADFRTFGLPGYPEIRLAIRPKAGIVRAIETFRPKAVHIVTEGPIGMAARRVCLSRGIPFTTSYHTRFPEYLRARAPVPLGLTYAWLRRFHNAGCGIMTATPSLDADLKARDFGPLMRWSRGVDTTLFHPREPFAPEVGDLRDLARPIFLTVGRVAVEKNLEAFLNLDLPGSKVVVGNGPALAEMKARFPKARFLGERTGADLAAIYAGADVFVFPSLTDTFGLVILEALASGLPVAAFPVMGPRDIIGGPDASSMDAANMPPVGILSDDLRDAAMRALRCDREACVRFAQTYSWQASATQFARNMREACHRFSQGKAASGSSSATAKGLHRLGAPAHRRDAGA